MRFALPASILLVLAPVAAQAPRDLQPQAQSRMRADIEFLCAPPLEGRASLSRGADAAAWFIAAEMRKAGLAPADGSSYLQRFDLVPLRLERERSAVLVRRGGAEQRFAPAAVFFPDPAREIHGLLRDFGGRRKIFNVHFRNIRGRRDDFCEVFPDEGVLDMVQVVRTLDEVGYTGMLMPDHVPGHPDDPGGRQAFAFAYGYIRGLLQALETRLAG